MTRLLFLCFLQLSNIETSKQQSKMLAALQAGNDVLKQLQSTMQIDDVKRLMEDTAEAKAYQVRALVAGNVEREGCSRLSSVHGLDLMPDCLCRMS